MLLAAQTTQPTNRPCPSSDSSHSCSLWTIRAWRTCRWAACHRSRPPPARPSTSPRRHRRRQRQAVPSARCRRTRALSAGSLAEVSESTSTHSHRKTLPSFVPSFVPSFLHLFLAAVRVVTCLALPVVHTHDETNARHHAQHDRLTDERPDRSTPARARGETDTEPTLAALLSLVLAYVMLTRCLRCIIGLCNACRLAKPSLRSSLLRSNRSSEPSSVDSHA